MIVHGLRSARHAPAYISLGSEGFIANDTAPVRSLMKRTFRHVLPPSFVRKTPRSAFGPNGWPNAATKATLASRGSTRSEPICPTSRRPTCSHVLPASDDLYTPRPRITLLRMAALP